MLALVTLGCPVKVQSVKSQIKSDHHAYYEKKLIPNIAERGPLGPASVCNRHCTAICTALHICYLLSPLYTTSNVHTSHNVLFLLLVAQNLTQHPQAKGSYPPPHTMYTAQCFICTAAPSACTLHRPLCLILNTTVVPMMRITIGWQ